MNRPDEDWQEIIRSEITGLWEAGKQADAARLERAGSNAWHWQGLSLRVTDALDLADVEPIVQSLQPEFPTVPIIRRTFSPQSMGNGIIPDFALLVVFNPAAIAFLAELGKDLYSGFRSALFAAYGKARGHQPPLGVEIAYEDEPQTPAEEGQNVKPHLYFKFSSGMDTEEFEGALRALLQRHSEIDRRPGSYSILLVWEGDSGTWIEEGRD